MASCCKFIKDPDDKWIVCIDWTNWVNSLIDDIGGTVDITQSDWVLDPGLTKEAATPTVDTDNKTFLYGSGGTAGTDYNAVNTITYNPSALTPTDFTESRTVIIRIRQK